VSCAGLKSLVAAVLDCHPQDDGHERGTAMTISDVPSVEPRQLLLDPEQIRTRPRRDLHPGVRYAILWRDGRDAAGVMWVEAGASVPEHTHDDASHHVWIIEGRARADQRTLGPGSYLHVPAGAPHQLDGLAPGGFSMFYLYLTE
jgi:mannose-6-phosphate isomerase-like protein (cupin superfamily)